MKELSVSYEESLVGELRLLDGDRYEFQYDSSWLSSEQAFPVSLALELREGPHAHQPTKSFFEGLIPEGDLLRQLELRAAEPIGSAFDFLAAYGRDCAGALTIQAASQMHAPSQVNIVGISWADLSKSFRENKTLAEVVLNEDGGFFSLAGAQDKIPVVFNENGLFISQGNTPTTHIIKPPNRYHPDALDSVYNEHFCMRLASLVGLPVPRTEVIEDEISFYVIERFDRYHDSSKVRRLHQQDFCQAQGVLSSNKYETQGGPSIKDNYNLISENSSQVLEDSKSFLSWVFFNLLIGNNDSHSKNLSFLMKDKKLAIAPFYDLLCTAVYPSVRKKFAFKIAGQVLWVEITGKHLRIIEKDLKLKNHFLSTILAELLERFEKALPIALQEMEVFREKTVFGKIEQEILRRARHFKKLLG